MAGAMALAMVLAVASVALGAAAHAQTGSNSTADAEKICTYGDLDNLGFGFAPGFDVFSGKPTDAHAYPWPNETNKNPTPDDPPGTDRIMVGSGTPAGANGRVTSTPDGYSAGSLRPANRPQALKLKCDAGNIDVRAVALQLFVDDFQPTVFGSKFTATVSGKHFSALEQVLNVLNQTGPIGKLVTIGVPADLRDDILNGDLLIDDATTSVGDGYALDFARVLINPEAGDHSGTVVGKVIDTKTNTPIADAVVTAAGTVRTTTRADGAFRLEGVPAGLAVLSATASGHIHHTQSVDLSASGTATLNFTLQLGADANPVANDPPAIGAASGTPPSGTGAGTGPAGDHVRSSFSASVVAASDISTRVADLARSGAVAALFVLLVAFPAELFNSTLSNHYDEVMAWFGPVARVANRLGRTATKLPSIVGFGIFAVVAGLLGGLLDPHFGFDNSSIALFIGLTASFVALTLGFGYTERRHMQRTHQDRGRLQVLPGTILVGAACVLVSRFAHIQPGYVYGLLAGYVFTQDVERRQQGRLSALSALVVLAGSIVAWIVWTPIGHMAAHQDPNIVVLVFDALLSALFVAGIESLVFGLMPLRFLEGEQIFRWNRLAWAGLYAIGMFTFVHVLLHPGIAYSGTDNGHAFITSLILFVLFAAGSIAFWRYFRNRSTVSPSPERVL